MIQSSATTGGSKLCFHFILHNSFFSLSVRRPAVGSSDWLDVFIVLAARCIDPLAKTLGCHRWPAAPYSSENHCHNFPGAIGSLKEIGIPRLLACILSPAG